jgi:hypothetical protein
MRNSKLYLIDILKDMESMEAIKDFVKGILKGYTFALLVIPAFAGMTG